MPLWRTGPALAPAHAQELDRGVDRADLRACDTRLLVVKNSYLAKVAAEKG